MIIGGIRIVLSILLAYVGLEVALSWAPLLALRTLRRRKSTVQNPTSSDTQVLPMIYIASACRDGAAAIEGLVKSFRAQNYPADRYRLFLAIDRTDNSAEIARSLGVEVFERDAPRPTGKGPAMNEILEQRIRQETFDVLVVLDVDGRVEPTFLRRTARYFQTADPLVVSCATFAKNPDETLFTRVGTRIQTLIRTHQEGRAALGLDAMLYGSHGYILSRSALDRLGWRTTTDLAAEDMELRLRAMLAKIPIRYAPDLPVLNDVTADAANTRKQRLRWNSTYLPLALRYLGPLTLRAMKGDKEALDDLFGVLLFPAFGNLFLYSLLLACGLSALAWTFPFIRPFAMAAAILWVLDAAYFMAVFRTAGTPLKWRDFQGFAAHIGVRLIALFEAIFFMHVKDWAPAPHKKDE